MNELAIGEVARRAGIRTSALRYYERVGLLPAPRRVSGRRRYDESTVQMLRLIQLAQGAGFTVAEIQTLLHGFAPDTPPAARWQPLARKKARLAIRRVPASVSTLGARGLWSAARTLCDSVAVAFLANKNYCYASVPRLF